MGGKSSGGGGGGGGSSYDNRPGQGYVSAARGGGTQPYGQGTNGAGGAGAPANAGVGISGGTGSYTRIGSFVDGFGWGGQSGASYGGHGCVRVVWATGGGQAFPSTLVAFRDGAGTNGSETYV